MSIWKNGDRGAWYDFSSHRMLVGRIHFLPDTHKHVLFIDEETGETKVVSRQQLRVIKK